MPRDEPPVEAAYQWMVPAEAVAPRVTVPASQRAPGVVVATVGVVLTVAITSDRADVQLLFVASTQYEVVDEIPGVVNDVPVPSDVPPVEAPYQVSVPAEAVAPRVTVPASQRAPGVVVATVGVVLTVAITSDRADVQLLFVASTQYEVVDEIPGVVNDVPVPSDVPPVEAAYQVSVPAEAVAPSVTVPVPHRESGVVSVIVGIVLTVAVTELRVPVVQSTSVASTQ